MRQSTVLLAFGVLFCHSAAAQTPSPGDVVINEVMYDPPVDQPSTNEWVELYNRSDETFDLVDLSFQDDQENPVPVTNTPTPIGPGEYAVLVRNPAAFDTTYAGVDFVAVSGFPALNNGGDTPAILIGTTMIDAVPYTSSWGGDDASLERLDPNAPSDLPSNWDTTLDPSGGTPGAENSVFEPDTTPPEPILAEALDEVTVLVTFSEPLDQVSAETAGNYEIIGIGMPVEATLTEPETVTLDLIGPLEEPQTYTLQISNVEDTQGNAIDQADIGFVFGEGDIPEPMDLVINEIAYDPPTDQPTSNEWIELYNRSDKTFDLADFSFQDDAENPVPVTETAILIESGAYAVLVRNPTAFDTTYASVEYVAVSGFPNLNNTGDIPVILYETEVIDAVPYASSWGGDDASLERIDPSGPSNFQGNWDTTTDPALGTPGEENSIFDPDITPPEPLEATAIDESTIVISFDEPLDQVSAETSGNYQISGVSIESATQSDVSEVTLELMGPLESPQTYTIEISGVSDVVGNAIELAEIDFLFLVGEVPEPVDIVINEIAYDPPEDQPTSNEWIELFNRSDKDFNLADFELQDDAESPVAITANPVLVEPGDYIVLTRNDSAFAADFPGIEHVTVAGFPNLNNSGDIPAILYETEVIDAVPYNSSWGGDDASLERVDPNGPSEFEGNWGTTTEPAFGTPGEENSIFDPDLTPPEPLEATATNEITVVISFDEPLDQVSAETVGNYQVAGTSVASATLTESSQVMLSLDGPLESPQSYTIEIFGVADLLGNTIDQAEINFVFIVGDTPEPLDLVINEISYDPAEGQPSDNEWIELFNRSAKNFDLSDFSIQNDAEEPIAISDTPVLLQPGGYTVVVRNPAAFDTTYAGIDHTSIDGFPALKNAADIPAILYATEVIDAVPYASSWGGNDASLERRDPDGPSFSPSNWATTTDPTTGTPGSQNSVFGPDTEGPLPVSATVDITGRQLTITFDEPLDPESVEVESFEIDGGISVSELEYGDGDVDVRLALAQPLPEGKTRITVRRILDLTGNERGESSIAIDFTPDTTPPQLASVVIIDSRTIDIAFSERISQNATFSIENGPSVDDVTYNDDPGESAQLILASNLPERELLRLVATHMEDRSGNVGEDSVPIFFGDADIARRGELVINEVMYDPANSSTGEFFELVNVTENRLFDLRDLSIDEDERPLKDTPAVVQPGGYLAIARNREEVHVSFPDAPNVVQADENFTLPNSENTLRLTSQGAVVDEVTYDPRWHREELDSPKGVSLERRDPSQPSDPTIWSSSLDPLGGTPGAPNSVSRQSSEPTDGPGLTLGPPFNPDAGDAATITYTLASEASLVRVRIFTGSGRQVRELESGVLSARDGSLTWDGRDDDGKRLRIGPYIVLLQAVDVEGGVTESYRGVVVLARQL